MAVNNIWAFNKGEWTEAYVFLKLLGDGRVYGAKEGLVRDENVFIDIVNILRYEREGLLKFEREMSCGNIAASLDDTVFKIICPKELGEKAAFLYNAIRKAMSGKGKLEVPEIQDYLMGLKCSSPKVPKLPAKAEAMYGSKTDIIITMEDSVDRLRTTEGFSIKSHLGHPSSLFNSTTNSGIVYEVVGCTEELMHKVNAIRSETKLIAEIKKLGMELRMIGSKSEDFKDNLDYIELTMLDVMNTAVLIQCGYLDKAASSDVKDIVKKVIEINPINMKNPSRWYETKFKDFLFASFSGMTAVKPWDGRRKVTGGYIDVNSKGEILYFRAVSDDIFGSYLYENTFMDRPSRGINKDIAHANAKAYLAGSKVSDAEMYTITHKADGTKKEKKGDWGYIYKDGDIFKFNINFQIRFK